MPLLDTALRQVKSSELHGMPVVRKTGVVYSCPNFA